MTTGIEPVILLIMEPTDTDPFITDDLNEFGEIHALEYEPTDTLIDVNGNVLWMSEDRTLRGVLENHTADEVHNWGYLNLK